MNLTWVLYTPLRRTYPWLIDVFRIPSLNLFKSPTCPTAEEEECQFDIPVSEMLAIQVRIVWCDKKNNIISHIGK